MFVKNFTVSGFKSLQAIQLTDLTDINVFHGDNNVGKSNILQALDVFFQLLPLAAQSLDDSEDAGRSISLPDLAPYTDSIFRQGAPEQIDWQVDLRLGEEVHALGLRLSRERDRSRTNGEGLMLNWLGVAPAEAVREALKTPTCDFNLVPATRRLSDEWLGASKSEPDLLTARRHGSPVEARNLKATLFNSVYAEDLSQRARFKHLVTLIAQTFNFGELDVALGGLRPKPRDLDEPEKLVRDYIVRFLRADLPRPVAMDDVGSGVQQLVMMLGQILFNPARLVGLEEPEMNLYWQRQDELKRTLRGLIAPDGVDQLFLTTHSGHFEFHENFFHVEFVDGATQVTRLPRAELPAVTGEGVPPAGPQTGQRLNSENQVTLDEEVLDDLNLKYGDMVYFRKNAAGRWEIWPEDEIMAEMREVCEHGRDEAA